VGDERGDAVAAVAGHRLNITAFALALLVALALVLPAQRARAHTVDEASWEAVVPITAVIGAAAALDLFMLGAGIAAGHGASDAWVATGIVVGAFGVGFGSIFASADLDVDALHTVGWAMLGGSALVIGATFWSVLLPSEGEYALLPFTDGERTSLVIAGRF